MIGRQPFWYRIHKVAKVYGMSPLEALKLPYYWIEVCEASEDADLYAGIVISNRRNS